MLGLDEAAAVFEGSVVRGVVLVPASYLRHTYSGQSLVLHS